MQKDKTLNRKHFPLVSVWWTNRTMILKKADGLMLSITMLPVHSGGGLFL